MHKIMARLAAGKRKLTHRNDNTHKIYAKKDEKKWIRIRIRILVLFY